jgi:hypothetical protein
MKQLLNHLYNGRNYLQRLILQLLLIILASGLVAAPAKCDRRLSNAEG